MAVALAVAAAFAWGCLEVVLLRSAKDVGALRLGFWLMVLGTGLIVPIALVSGSAPGLDDLPVAILPALVGLAGSGLYFIALREGKLTLVSPTVGTSGGIGAVLAIVVLGEHLGGWTVVALAAAVAGVVLASSAPRTAGGAGGMGWAVAAALLLGVYTVVLAVSAEELGPLWAVAAYRVTGIVVLGSILLFRRQSPGVGRTAMRTLVVAALLETVGFVTFTTALTLGPVAVVSVIMAQFATVAVVLATVLLHERLLTRQWVGVGWMLVATAVLAASQ